jgi:hypothetical protein
MKALLIPGVALLILSAKPLALMGREFAVGSAVNSRYSVERITGPAREGSRDAVRATIGTHTVALEDDQPVQGGGPDVRVDGPVRIKIDGKDYSHPALATIRLSERDAGRYWGYVYLMRLVGRQERTQQLVVAQNIGRYQFRTVSLSIDGRVVEDRFDYEARCSPPVRALLIRTVVPHPSGFCSDVMAVGPSYFYPLLYPWISGIVGVVFVMLGLVRRTTPPTRATPAA